MKWKHKTLGWTAQNAYYEMPESHINCTINKDNNEIRFQIPRLLIDNDDNWQEVPDGRWLNYKVTAREFMEAFSMVITEGGSSHDSFVVKNMIDKMLNLNNINNGTTTNI